MFNLPCLATADCLIAPYMITLKTLNVLIVDDDVHCLDVLELMLLKSGIAPDNFTRCHRSTEAVQLIPKLSPDLVFLDVQMPELNGFELLEQLVERNFSVVFTTGYDSYALQALKASALDYILKPVSEDDLRVALQKCLTGQQQLVAYAKATQFQQKFSSGTAKPQEKITLPTLDDVTVFKIAQITHFEANDNLSYLYLFDGQKIPITLRLKNLELQLREYSFFRIHKKYLVNLHHVKKVRSKEGNEVVLDNGSKVLLSRYRKNEFLDILSQL